MATKVNTKFVVGLLAVMLIAVGGVGYLAMRAFTASGERQHAMGEAALVRYEQALAAGNEEEARRAIREAASSFERAVGREPTRVEWLEQWHDALMKVVPNSPTDAQRQYQWYRQIPRSIAMLQPENTERALLYFERLWETGLEERDDIGGLELVATEVDTLTRQMPADDPGTKRVQLYKAMAIVRLMGITTVEEERRSEARETLEEVVEALPSDPMPRVWLARWHLTNERRLRDARRADEATAELEAAERVVVEGIAEIPDSIALRLQAVDVTRIRELRAGRSEAIPELLRPMVREIVELLREVPAESLDPLHLASASQLSRILGMNEAYAESIGLLEAQAESDPTDARVWLILGQLHELRGEYERQMEVAGRVLSLPDPTVGFDSLRMPDLRRAAAQMQLDSALAQWEVATTDEERQRLEALAEEKMEAFAARVPTTMAYQLSDRRGRMALLRGNAGEALAPLAEAVRGYEAAGATPPLPTLRNLATALEQNNNPGEARRAWRRVLSRATQGGGDDPLARLRIGALSADMREYDAALEEFELAAEILGPGGRAQALFAKARLYELLLERDETITLPGRGELSEQQLLAEAMQIFQELRELSPENEQVLAALSRLSARSGGGGDPEMVAVMKVQEQAEAGDLAAAEQTIAEAIAAGYGTPRLWLLRTELLNRLGQADAALEAIEEAAQLYPENTNIQRMLRLARSDDPMEASLAEIEDPFQRALARFQIAASRNDEPAMEAALEEARSIDPESSTLLELDFERAIQRRDWGRADALARRAGERNADQVGGLLFTGRLQYARGNYADAVRTLREAVEQLEFNPVAWRWLGVSQLRLGQTNDAVESLARATQGRPSDERIARDYANALIRVGRGADALAAIDDQTGVLRFGRRSPEMVELWLDLAVRFGGAEGRETALRERRAMYERNPSNAVNAERLAQSLFDIQAWDEADQIIQGLRENPDVNPMGLAALRAQWLQRQGRVEEAVGLFESHIASNPELRDSPAGPLTFGELLLQFGLPDRALEQFERADELSEAGQTQAARRAADLYFQAGTQGFQSAEQLAAQGQEERSEAVRERASEFLSQAIERYERVLASIDPEASPEDHAAVGLRIVEGQLQLERTSDAERTLSALSSLPDNDLRRSILRARVAQAGGDARQARRIMDEAVRDHPNDALAFLNRARINSGDEALMVDVLADLDRAASLQPANIEIWQYRVALLRERGQMDSAVASLRSAIQINPNQDNLRTYLIDTLINAGRTAEAADEAIELADDRPRNLEVQGRTIMLLQQTGRWSEAVRLLDRLRELEPNNAFYAASWIEARLNANGRLTPAEANPALRVVRSSPAYGTPSEPISWATAEARATHALSQAMQSAREAALAQRYRGESTSALSRGVRLIGESDAAARSWFNAAVTVLGGGAEAMQLARTTLGDQPVPPMLRALEQSLRLMAAGNDPSITQEVIASTESLLTEFADQPAIRLELLKTRGLAATQAEEHAKATESFEAILELNPNDAVALNNLAYMLATQTGEPARALEYAERARSIAPENSTVLDTLGTVYLSFDPPRYADAERVLRQAVSFGRTPDELFPANLHLAQALIGLERMPQARSAAEAARRAMSDADPTLRRTYEPQIEALEEQIRR